MKEEGKGRKGERGRKMRKGGKGREEEAEGEGEPGSKGSRARADPLLRGQQEGRRATVARGSGGRWRGKRRPGTRLLEVGADKSDDAARDSEGKLKMERLVKKE